MDFHGTSDPYVQIFSDPPQIIIEGKSHLKTKVIEKNLNPKWDESLTITIKAIDLNGLLRNGHLFFSVWDEDNLIRDLSMSHDLIGVTPLSFKNIFSCLSNNKPFNFEQSLASDGCLNGKIYGKITGDISATHKKQIRDSVVMSERPNGNGCGCTVS